MKMTKRYVKIIKTKVGQISTKDVTSYFNPFKINNKNSQKLAL